MTLLAILLSPAPNRPIWRPSSLTWKNTLPKTAGSPPVGVVLLLQHIVESYPMVERVSGELAMGHKFRPRFVDTAISYTVLFKQNGAQFIPFCNKVVDSHNLLGDRVATQGCSSPLYFPCTSSDPVGLKPPIHLLVSSASQARLHMPPPPQNRPPPPV